ncbi:MAG: DNA mismatch repair endonuclease MutL, partial [Kiritimatiellae bacterium]|nr:DNA mismatch repair endonuclease MutL [Kiritimatiellia bacterium]
MPKDGHIKLLPLHVANKIAAGEVVERPASVVKELVENAIDAGAGRIDITITAGGRKLIGVRDDGCGMERDDALLCLERQATSKISDVEDIERIATLGFRGEAIPSIASVSRMLIKTRRPQDDAGIQLTVTGGTLQEVRDIGAPAGTDIEVRDLFFNVPVRRKFLRAYQTEQAHIRSVLTLHALAHPDIGFTLSADGRELYNLPPGANLKERAVELFGRDFVADLRSIDYRAGAIHVYGYASLPTQTRNDRSEQYVFVNRRPATAPVIAYALREAYPPMDAKDKPILLLFIDLPPECVDVNVHPTKREVRFTHPADVREAIILAVSRAIGRERAAPPDGS